MAGSFNLRAIISATDKLSPILKAQTRQLNAWKRQFAAAGKGAIPMAAGLGAAVMIPARAFVEAENAATQLKNTLMNKDGVSEGFAELSKISVELGNQLPGTTADFMSMASQLRSLGVSAEAISGGALKATAYLAVVGKGVGVTYESAAEAVGKLGNAFGIASGDLVSFADTLQRTLHMGVDLSEMQYAMSRVSGILKGVGKSGLGVANELAPLVAMLIKSGVSGEEAGTGISKMIQVAAAKGKFTTIPNLVKDLEAMNKLSPSKKLEKFKDWFGEEHMKKALIIAGGGYKETLAYMEKQASMQIRINNSLGTLGALWEAAAGTFTNAMVAFATAYAPELKQLTQAISDISTKLLAWSDANGSTIKMALKTAAAFVGMKLGFLAAAAGLSVLTAIARTNPILLLIQGIAIAAPLIYENWGKIIEFIKNSWQAGLEWLDKQFQTFVDGLLTAVNAIRSMFNFSDIKVTLPKLSGPPAGEAKPATGASGFFANAEAADGSMALPGVKSPAQVQRDHDARKRMAKTGTAAVKGAIDVNFNNAPQGMRVEQSKGGNVAVKPNVGYRTLGQAGAQ